MGNVIPQPDPLSRYVPDSNDPWDYPKAAHLLRRSMIAPADAEIRRAVEEGLDATIARLMTPFAPDLELVEDFLGHDPLWTPPPEPEYHAWSQLRLDRRDRLCRWAMKCAVYSPVSLQERMTFFWHSHFTSSLSGVEDAEWMADQHTLLREQCLGNFKTLVEEITVDMSMLIYLNGIDNRKSQVNENYARELMELFTMGIFDQNGRENYTQADVVAAAHSLTGWDRTSSPLGEIYRGLKAGFQPDRWDDSEKTFMGRTGRWREQDIIEIIFEERGPQIARFICQKIYRAFVSPKTDPTAVDAMAALLRKNDWELRPLMEALLTSVCFYRQDSMGVQYKDHLQFYLGVIRALGVENVSDFDVTVKRPYDDLYNRLVAIGQMMFLPPSVKGWPEGRAWVTASTLAPRQKFALDVIAFSPFSIYNFDPIRYARTFPDPYDVHALVSDITRHLLPMELSDEESKAMLDVILDGGPAYEWSLDDPTQRPDTRIRKLLKEIVRHPAYQLY